MRPSACEGRVRGGKVPASRGSAPPEDEALGYLIAAYALVLGTLLGYGLWLQSQRRALMSRGEADEQQKDGGEPPR